MSYQNADQNYAPVGPTIVGDMDQQQQRRQGSREETEGDDERPPLRPEGPGGAYHSAYHDYMESANNSNNNFNPGPNNAPSGSSPFTSGKLFIAVGILAICGIFFLRHGRNSVIPVHRIDARNTPMHLEHQEVPQTHEEHKNNNEFVSGDSAGNEGGGDHANTNAGNTPNGGTVSNDHSDGPWEGSLKIVYLLAYPRSGASYTSFLIARATNRTLATNQVDTAYVDGQGFAYLVYNRSVTMNNNDPHGRFIDIGSPYWDKTYYKQTARPKHLVLTISQCTGYCLPPCGPSEYIETDASFEEKCRDVNRGPILLPTPKSEVKKIVHLIRDPFSNIVSRFHDVRDHHMKYKSRNSTFSGDDRTEFHHWCNMDEAYSWKVQKSPLIANEVKLLMKNVPCATEFFKYFTWHNHVVEMIWNEDYESMEIYYEEYNTESLRQTLVNRLAAFMNYPVVDHNTFPSFLSVTSYTEYFTVEEKKKVEKLMRALALTHTARLLDRYFHV